MSGWDKAAIGVMGAVGGTLSYDALQQMAVAMHVRSELSYLFPVAIDGFIAYGVRALVVLKEAPLRARAYTWSVFGGATATSVWANWTHAVRLNESTPPGQGLHLTNTAVGALSTIAPLVLGGATHLYIVMSRHAAPTAVYGEPDDAQAVEEETLTVRSERTDSTAPNAVRSWWRTRFRRSRSATPELDHDQSLLEQPRLRLVSGDQAGPSGPVSSAGPSGPVPSAGPSGPVSSAGPSGPVPSAGPSGPVSSAGPSGPVPSAGPSGPVSSAGPSGPVPSAGPSAPVSSAGSSGPVSSAGPSAPVPSAGPSAPVPSAGSSRPVSSAGSSGPVSSAGPSGPVSSAGPSGPVSSAGPSGPVPSAGPSGPVSSAGSSGPVPATGRKRVPLETLVPVAREAAARAGRVNREVVADGLRDQGYSISNERMGKLLQMIDDTNTKPPPKPAASVPHPLRRAPQRPVPTPNSLPRKRS
ncbi:DUF2637 domain-containing protein [Streptomyces sp. CBMA123]|uniref:DUF2637 domain-containing protein n=1 Tax=Streptomyces sp. CBMA123 TaxID=1896313 RepID=UPI0016619EC9|nr:DUF2637 domain-containing protein [Streptomyces sp. CBMA123]